MAIWNRFLSRKSASSTSSSGEASDPAPPALPATTPTAKSSTSDAATASSDSTSPRSPKSSNRLAKTLSWRPKPSKESSRPASTYVHPTERPLTEVNLRHQEILGAFTFDFGRRRSSAGGWTTHSNISPGNSRAGSIDATAHPHHHHPSGHMVVQRVNSLGVPPPKEEDGE